jgi:hypothetical protein
MTVVTERSLIWPATAATSAGSVRSAAEEVAFDLVPASDLDAELF